MNANAIFGGNDNQVNGDILVYTREGAIYEDHDPYTVCALTDMNMAANVGQFTALDVTRDVALAFIALNYNYLRLSVPTLTPVKLCEIAYLRFLAMKYQLVSSNFDAAQNNCDYNQCHVLRNHADDADLTAAMVLANNDDGFAAVQQAPTQVAIAAHLTAARRSVLNKLFCNFVCLVAYMFRTRGHHFQDDYTAKYAALWNKTATKELQYNLDWKEVSCYALHAIMPNVLDLYWRFCVDNNYCDPILSLRYTSAAAGTALFPVLHQGLADLRLVIPNIDEVMPDEIDYINRINQDLSNNRWRHSVNARFYGAERARLDERQTGAVGALIRACVESLAAESDIANSKALQRAAKLAPITGAAYGQAIKNYVKSDRFLVITKQ